MKYAVEESSTTFKEELKIIPKAAWIVLPILLLLWFGLAVPAIVGTLPKTTHVTSEQIALTGVCSFLGLIISVWMMLVFYVNVDAARRRMSRLVWTILVIFIPYGIGFIVYYFVRRPFPQSCPSCQTLIQPDFIFCPRCNTELKPKCPACNHRVESAWINCPYCGTKLSSG